MTSGVDSDSRTHLGRSGFALILVLWITALVSLLAVGIIWSARLNVQTAGNVLQNAKAEALADGGVALVKLTAVQTLQSDGQSQDDARVSGGRPAVICAMGEDALAAIAVESNAGKIDLNIASVEDLERLLLAAGANGSDARAVVRSIVEYRSISGVTEPGDQYHPDPRGRTRIEPKRAPFETTLELDQVEGMQPEWLDALLPYVTASPRAAEFDPAYASPLLRDVLNGIPAAGSEMLATSLQDAEPMRESLRSRVVAVAGSAAGIVVHVEIATKGGGYFVREVNMLVTGGADPVQIVEWRQGRRRYFDALSGALRHLESEHAAYRRCDRQD